MEVCSLQASYRLERERERERPADIIRVCAACSIISVLTQWGATLVTKNKREREREREGSWLELMASAAGLDGEVRGTKVALRECSRLIGVAQPLAGAWLQAIPGPNQFRLRSTLYVIALQRWLGLPIHMASAAAKRQRGERGGCKTGNQKDITRRASASRGPV
jgi:hypothetical protein